MATTKGIIAESICSAEPASAIYYSVNYTAERASEGIVYITLNFSEWQKLAGSYLGVGSKLTIFARANGGEWKSTVLKDSSVAWNSTTRGTALITLSADTKSSLVSIDFYITCSGSSFGSKVGEIGTASSPYNYKIIVPEYSTIVVTSVESVHLKESGIWREVVPYVKINDKWEQAFPYIKIDGVWE